MVPQVPAAVALGLLDTVLVRLIRLVVCLVVLRLGHLESLAAIDQHKATNKQKSNQTISGRGGFGLADTTNTT